MFFKLIHEADHSPGRAGNNKYVYSHVVRQSVIFPIVWAGGSLMTPVLCYLMLLTLSYHSLYIDLY